MAVAPAMAAMIIALTACGGGGGGGSDGPTGGVAGTAGAGGGTATTPGTGDGGQNGGAGTAPGTPSYAGTEDGGVMEAATFGYLNTVRIKAGAGALGQDGALDASARSHSAYTLANPTEVGFEEVPGHAGYSGVGPVERLAAAGYTGQLWNEGVIGRARLSGDSAAQCAQILLNSMYTMAALLGPFTDVGIGYKTDAGGAGFCVMDFGFKSGLQYAAAGAVVSYPYPGQTDAMAGFLPDGERPRPTTALPTQVGQPILASMASAAVTGGDASGRGSIETFELRDASGRLVPAMVMAPHSLAVATGIETLDDAANDAKYPPYGAFLVPKAPLAERASYTVSFAGHFNGVAHAKTWSFTTRSTF